MKVRELDVFTVRMERERLAKDADAIISIFAILESLDIPVECVAVNIDWFAVTMRIEQKLKMMEYMQKTSECLKGLNITQGNEFRILSLEEDEFTARRVGMIISCLELQDVDILMCRQIKNNKKLVLGFHKNQFEKAKKIVSEILHI